MDLKWSWFACTLCITSYEEWTAQWLFEHLHYLQWSCLPIKKRRQPTTIKRSAPMRKTNCLSHWNMVVFISFKILKHYIELVHVSITICRWLFQEVLVQPHWKHKSNNYTSNRNSHNICVWGHVMIFTWWHTQVLFNQYPCMCHQVEITICGQTLLVVPIAVKVCNQGFFQTLCISYAIRFALWHLQDYKL